MDARGWLALALLGGACGGDEGAMDVGTSVESSTTSTEPTGGPPLVEWNEILFVRSIDSNAFVMTADRFGVGLGPILQLPELTGWRGASADGTAIAWHPHGGTTLHVLREGEPTPRAVEHVVVSYGWATVGSRMLVVLAEPGDVERVAVLDLDTDDRSDLPLPASPSSHLWSESGAMLACEIDDSLWIADIDAGTVRELVELGSPSSYAWADDGTHVVVGRGGDVSVVDVVAGDESLVVSVGDLGPEFVSVSPDRRWITWLELSGGEVGIARMDGTQRSALVEFVDGPIAWSPSSERIALSEVGHGGDCLDGGCAGITVVEIATDQSRFVSGTSRSWAAIGDWLAVGFENDLGHARVRTHDVAGGEAFDVSALPDDSTTRDWGLTWR